MKLVSTPFRLSQDRPAYPPLALRVVRLRWPVVWLTGLGLLSLFVFLLALIQFATPNLIDNDGYYHIKLAQLMRTQGLRPAFPWLPLTILNPDAFVDHHFLYHSLITALHLWRLTPRRKMGQCDLAGLYFSGRLAFAARATRTSG